MHILNLGEIDAVAFDIDGTLYRNHNLYLRLIPHYLGNLRFFRKYNQVRKELRARPENADGYSDFFATQKELLAQKLCCTPQQAEEYLDKIVYSGLKKYFQKIKPCRGAPKLISALKKAGVKIALLSDFPPEQKGELWGIKENCDLLLSTEEIGALKPSAKPFEVLSQKLGVAPEKILYVGNRHAYDVEGPKNVGLKTAWFIPRIRGIFGCRSKLADITFCSYRQFERIIFNSASE